MRPIYQKRREDGNTKRCNAEGGERVEEELEELEESVDAMRKELIRLRWKAEALETAVAVLFGIAGGASRGCGEDAAGVRVRR